MLRLIYDWFCDWADRLINWLKNFVAKIFRFIKNWFNALFDYINNMLANNDEAIIVDTKTDIGAEIFDMVCQRSPSTTSINKYNKDGKIVMGAKNGSITRVENYQADQVENSNTDFDRDLAQEGIIRMTN